ncbi:arginine--tRNA ligase [bacterium K02(2017)]|nr:arginine--tRNA ligase [bacterium K02(2017)]
MASVLETLKNAFDQALIKLLPANETNIDSQIVVATDKKFGDYQCNVAMTLTKKLKRPPREIAQSIIDQLELADVCEKIEIAGPGFINLHLKTAYLINNLQSIQGDDRLGVLKSNHPIKHIVDFSSPNLAKEMHVGHLRTTITGEVVCRVLEFLGHELERISHVGDWGTQFGMLLQHVFENHPEVLTNPEAFQVQDLEGFYKAAKKRFDEDSDFMTKAREKVVLLQSGDEVALNLWKVFVKESLRHCHEIYHALGVKLTEVGESFYNERLPKIVNLIEQKGLAVTNDGAVCVFLDGYLNRDGEPLPMIIKKSDGGYNYTTTDLAAIKYRIEDRGGKRLIYVTDLRQAQHFKMFFELARKLGWASESIQLDHIGYGMVLGSDRKPFKTRDGGTVRLKQLIEEAKQRAAEMMDASEKGEQNMDAAERENIIQAVGLAAIKYADLSHSLASDYVFSWEKMLAMDGNTGPYMLYAYTRIMGIGRKAGIDMNKHLVNVPLILEHPTELNLATHLIRFNDVVHDISKSLKPNILTDYLYGVSRAFSTFYDKKAGVSILEAQTPALKQSRLSLCQLTARTLKLGLNLLSIEVVEKM